MEKGNSKLTLEYAKYIIKGVYNRITIEIVQGRYVYELMEELIKY